MKNYKFELKKKNIVRFVKSQRLRWAAHVIRMDTIRTVKKLTGWEPCSSRPAGRPRLRWLEQVEEDLKEMKVRNWREKCNVCGSPCTYNSTESDFTLTQFSLLSLLILNEVS